VPGLVVQQSPITTSYPALFQKSAGESNSGGRPPFSKWARRTEAIIVTGRDVGDAFRGTYQLIYEVLYKR
jgi:hypothetical protein